MGIHNMGKRIAELRKRSGMTQSSLAKRLGISDRTISKWESGQGYPDIAILPQISAAFGVSIDYLMLGQKKGIAIAGNVIADVVKSIAEYPKQGMLTHVFDAVRAVGGCVPNTAINLARIDSSIPIWALGKVGSDENGRFILSQMQKKRHRHPWYLVFHQNCHQFLRCYEYAHRRKNILSHQGCQCRVFSGGY